MFADAFEDLQDVCNEGLPFSEVILNLPKGLYLSRVLPPINLMLIKILTP